MTTRKIKPLTPDEIKAGKHLNIPNYFSQYVLNFLVALFQEDPKKRPTSIQLLYFPHIHVPAMK